VYPGFAAGTTGAALLGVIGILAALWARDETGAGQHVDTSLVDGNLAYLAMYWQRAEVPTMELGISNDPRRRLVVGAMEGSDGEYVWVHSAAGGAHKQAMEVFGLADRVRPAQGPIEMAEPLSDDEAELLATELPRIFRSRPRDEWIERFRTTDVAAVPALRPGEAFAHPQVVHNEMTTIVDDLELGPVTQVGIAAKFAESAPGPVGRAPGIGEHTDDVLANLGYSESEILELRSKGVVE
jgi:crotonobetainyl-CoA:carnitine CoA-transferase CaiB-like acyl-CoA transferase